MENHCITFLPCCQHIFLIFARLLPRFFIIFNFQNVMILYFFVIALLLTFHFFPLYNVYRDRIVHFVTERSDPMKKYNCLLIPLVSAFLLLCACAGEQTSPASSNSDTFSSVPTSSVPTSSVSATSMPIRLTMDWVVEDREIVPFEDRFKEDVPFGTATSWLVHQEGNHYIGYYLSKQSLNNPNWLTIIKESAEDGEIVYEIPVARDLTDFNVIAADGRWGYLLSDNELLRIDLLTGDCTSPVKFSSHSLSRYIWVCGKDTLCICTLDQEYNLRFYYRDLHSNAEKTIYEGNIPATPLEDMTFYGPSTTQGQVSWIMMNPDFFEVLKRELNDSNSQFRTLTYYGELSRFWDSPEKYHPSIESVFFACIPIQDYYDIPARVRYTYDPKTGELLPDYGILCSCERGTGRGHNHFDYEITKEETPEILKVESVEIPNIITLTEAQAEAVQNQHALSWISKYTSKNFGYPLPYRKHNGIYTRLADIPIIEMVSADDYTYCITTENTIIQLNYDGQICNTIYSSDNTLGTLFFWSGNLYFIDGKTIICIDTVAGTWRPILKTTLKDLYINGEYWDRLYFGVRQGMYCQEYTFDVDAGILQEESYI